MANENSENNWIIENYNHVSNNSFMSVDLLCTICSKTMIHSCYLLCGCKFCWDCIKNYLNGSEKCCPGPLVDCQTQLLKIDGTILIDKWTVKLISRIIVKYPEQFSKVNGEYNKLEDLIQDCHIGKSKCPYFLIGCNEVQILTEDVPHHLNSDNYLHTTLLMECIDNMTKELKYLKTGFLNSKRENQDLREEIELIKMDASKKQAIIFQLLKSDRNKSEQIKNLISLLNETGNSINDQIQLDEIEPSRFNNSQSESFYSENDTDYFIEYASSISGQIEVLNTKVSELESNLVTQNHGEFVWKIDGLSQKIKESQKSINKEIYSDSFFSHKNGYKLCLRLDPRGIDVDKGSHLAVYFCILQGPFDDVLSWPMQRAVTLSLLDQQSGGGLRASRTAHYHDVPDNFAWNRPTTDRLIGFGFHKFIAIAELLADDRLYRDDRIFIKCSVEAVP